MLPFRVLREARRELLEAALWYKRDELEVRRFLLQRFPYAVVIACRDEQARR